MDAFVYSSPATRVVFGPGAVARLPEEIERLGATRALVLSTAQQSGEAEALVRRLGARAVGVFDRAEMHVPVEVAREASREARRLGADCAIAIGGGSTTGLGKAIALDCNLPIIAIPTTYAGSEMTPIYGLTESGRKKTGRDWRVLPKIVIYDPMLTLSLPVALSITSGINALAHAAEALYAEDRNPVTDLMAAEGIRALAAGLPKLRSAPQDLDARALCLLGAWLCGTALGQVGMALHHKLCHVLGGSFNLSHAETHAVVLPHAIAYNSSAAPSAAARIARAIGCERPAEGLYDLAQSNGAPVALRELGLAYADLDAAADLACSSPYWNPRPVTRADVRSILEAAWHGRRPETPAFG